MPARDAHPCGGLIANGTGCGECAWCELELRQMPLDVNDWPAGIERPFDYDLVDWYWLDDIPDTTLAKAVMGIAGLVLVAALAYLASRV